MRKALLVGLYDTNTAALAPEILRAYVSRFPVSRRWKVSTLNLSIFSQTVEEMAEAIGREKPDVVGFSAYIWNIEPIRKLVDRVPGLVVVGGPQCNDDAARLLSENPGIDAVASGEGEETFKELLEALDEGRPLDPIAGLTTRGGGGPPRPVLADLDAVPSPYETIFRERPGLEWIAYETSRGCPYLCGFCTWGYSKKMRYHGLERVFADLDVLLSQPSLKRIYLCDSSLLLDKPRAKKILRHVIAKRGDVSLRYEFNAEQLDDEIVDLLAQLHGNEFNLGLQTTNPAALKLMRRPFQKRRFEASYAKLAARAPGAVTMDVIYGLPGDDLDAYKASLDYAMSFEGVRWILTNPLILLPGSDYHRDAERHGLKTRGDESGIVVSTASFPAEQMREAIKLSFLVSVVFFNERLREAMRAFSRERGARFVDVVEDFFARLPFDLLGGRPYPYMVPSVAKDFRDRNLAVARVVEAYPKLVAAFDAYSGGAYAARLAGYESAFVEQYRRLERFAREATKQAVQESGPSGRPVSHSSPRASSKPSARSASRSSSSNQ